jgi:repressor LexA
VATKTDDRPPLTTPQRRILDAIKQHIKLRGYPPSVRNLQATLKLGSSSTIHYHLLKLEVKGYIERDEHTFRGLRVIPDSNGTDEA